MVFYILISVVFIAELIIVAAILTGLFKFNKTIKEYNFFIEELNPKISDLLKTFTQISEQMVKLAPIFVDKIKSVFTNIIMNQLKSTLGALIFWAVKKEVEKHVTQ